MPSSEFQKICRDLSQLGDTCTISCTKEGVKFSVTGDIGTGNVQLRPTSGSVDDEAQRVMVDMEEPLEQSFALRYLSMFTRATTLSKTVTLSMSRDVPLVVDYSVRGWGVGTEHGRRSTGAGRARIRTLMLMRVSPQMEGLGNIRYYLAPKIDEE